MHQRFQHPVTEQIYQVLAEIEQAETRLQKALTELPTFIGDNVELRQAVICHLYWYEERMKPYQIAEAFKLGTHANTVSRIAGNARLNKACSKCGSQFEVTVTSRANLKEALSDTWRAQRLCGSCQEKEDVEKAQNDSQWAQEYQARQEALQARIAELRMMPYRDYLQTPEWQARRARAMKRAGFRCQVCNAYGVRLNTHHRTYERRGNEDDRDLITLCENCHRTFHENGRLVPSGED